MRRGIFGGSFNPIHNGHVRMALSAMESLSLDFISVIPLGNPPHKTNYELLEGFHRFQMCKFAFEGYNNIEISSMEIDSPKQSFTINTIHQLRAIYPEDELYLIMGTDMFLSLPQWYHYQELLKLVKICVAAREHQQEEKIIQFRDQLQSQGAEVYIIPQEALPISATEIRGQLSHGKEPDLLSPKVLEYIFQNKLYCTNKEVQYDLEWLDQQVKAQMDQKRYQHSLYVSHEAIRLAKRYGASVHLAQTAGLLHDICKQMPTEEQLQWVLKSDIIWDTTTLKQQHLLHGMAAAEYIQSQLGIYQRDVVHAVRYHTIGRPNMSLLEKIIFVADLTSAERDYPDVETTRMLANQSLDAAVAYIMRHTIGMLVKKQLPISHNTRDTYNYYATSTTHT